MVTITMSGLHISSHRQYVSIGWYGAVRWFVVRTEQYYGGAWYVVCVQLSGVM